MRRNLYMYGHGEQVGLFVIVGITKKGMELVYSVTRDRHTSATACKFFQLLPAAKRTDAGTCFLEDNKLTQEYLYVQRNQFIREGHPHLAAACKELLEPLVSE